MGHEVEGWTGRRVVNLRLEEKGIGDGWRTGPPASFASNASPQTSGCLPHSVRETCVLPPPMPCQAFPQQEPAMVNGSLTPRPGRRAERTRAECTQRPYVVARQHAIGRRSGTNRFRESSVRGSATEASVTSQASRVATRRRRPVGSIVSEPVSRQPPRPARRRTGSPGRRLLSSWQVSEVQVSQTVVPP